MNLLRLLASCLVLALLAACDRGPLSLTGPPTGPSAPIAPQPPPTPVAPPILPGDTPATSVLGVTKLDVPAPIRDYYFNYRVQLTLTELTGHSGAWIHSMDVLTDTGYAEPGCTTWRAFRIEPGATWESSRLGYCEPSALNLGPASRLTVTITYTDDAGRPGSLERVVDLTR